MSRNRRPRSDGGLAFVETALALPVLAAFILGLVGIGSALNKDVVLQQAARDSARYGSRLDPFLATGYDQGSWAANAASLATARDADLAGGTLCVAAVVGHADGSVSGYVAASGPGVGGTYSSGAAGGICWATTAADGIAAGQVYVQVSASLPEQLRLYLATQTITLRSRSMTPAEWVAR